MLKTNCDKHISEIVFASNTIVEYLFDCHDYCYEKWYKSKQRLNNKGNKKEEELRQSCYRSKEMSLSCTHNFGMYIDLLQPTLDFESLYIALTFNRMK